jgi:hypothetical protein
MPSRTYRYLLVVLLWGMVFGGPVIIDEQKEKKQIRRSKVQVYSSIRRVGITSTHYTLASLHKNDGESQ